jgi:palmitoyltransferase
MDHHCPWIGGCVGAHNQRFFFVVVFWLTLLEIYTLVTTAVYFRRGLKSRGAGYSAWSVDGYLISLFPICALFFIFTGTLLATHVFLLARNITTVEHVGISTMQGRERVVIERWIGSQSRLPSNSTLRSRSTLGGVKAKRQMLQSWNWEWGSPTKEGNRWWLGGRDEIEYLDPSPNSAMPSGGDETARDQEKMQPTRSASDRKINGRGAWSTNMRQALGRPSLWLLPVGAAPNKGLEFPLNPRFGPDGIWRKRREWPAELQ